MYYKKNYSKYLKYKQKYNNLKKQMGGTNPSDDLKFMKFPDLISQTEKTEFFNIIETELKTHNYCDNIYITIYDNIISIIEYKKQLIKKKDNIMH